MKRLWTLTAATIALLLLLSAPTLTSVALTNATMLALRDGLMAQENLALGTYPHYNALPDDLNSPFTIYPWALGRAVLAVGDAETAADALRPLIAQADRNPILYNDLLTALSRGAEPEDVLAPYEAARRPSPPRRSATRWRWRIWSRGASEGAGWRGRRNCGRAICILTTICGSRREK